eukprot:gene4163-5927_t
MYFNIIFSVTTLTIFGNFQNTVLCQNFAPLAAQIGGTFCKYLTYKSQLPRNFFRDCAEPSCSWDDWSHTSNMQMNHTKNNSSHQRIILSYAHNGFGNQLWQHSVAFMIAESLKAQLYIATIPENLSPGNTLPPNTWAGMDAMSRLLPGEFLYEKLPDNSSVKEVCDKESFFLSDRPVDWRDRNYSSNFKPTLYGLLTDKKIRCLKMVGYFQNLPLCIEDARSLWTPRMFANFTNKPGKNDISIYLRCLPRHYHFNDKHFYESILNHTTFDRVWLFQSPTCPTKLSGSPEKDGLVASVVRLLTVQYNATRWPQINSQDETDILLQDLAGLAQSSKLILPSSSWAYWAGLFSNATEIHVNAPPYHQLMYGKSQYIYHNEKEKKFYGYYNATSNDIEYQYIKSK